MDTFVRLTKSPVVSIAKIRGCVRGVSSEFVLACDMRFASRENTLLGQPEVGVGVNPGGGGAERLPHLVGRGRALEIILGANDFDGDTAERYGYINRALPDEELDGFVDALARRIASFDRRPIAAAKNLINQVSLPYADRLLDALNVFQTALMWPETQQRIQALLKGGLQREGDLEKRWTAAARHAGDVVIVWERAASLRWQINSANHHNRRARITAQTCCHTSKAELHIEVERLEKQELSESVSSTEGVRRAAERGSKRPQQLKKCTDSASARTAAADKNVNVNVNYKRRSIPK